MDRDDEDNLPEDSDSDDEDFMPGTEPKQDLSEEEDDGDEEVKTDKKKSSSKKRKNGKLGRARKSKKRKAAGESDEESDDEDDVDFVLNEKEAKVEDEEKPEDPEIVAARDKADKARTDVLWADFLNSVETTKAKKNNQKEPETKMVTKVYDFAGERVEIQEKVKVTPEDSETRSSTSSSISTAESSTSDSKKVNSNGVGSSSSSSLNGAPSSGQPPDKDNKLQLPRKIRISFLSGDPADIGLSEKKVSAREGLANVLNALQARKKKLGTLEKSKLDWETYKQQQGLQEELHGHTKSKHGYIDKQEFLQRADLRQFEIEKEARSKRRRNP